IRYERTRDGAWLRTWKAWVRVFALTSAMGVVSGVTMSFQFGTNWPGYMNHVGNIAGPLLAYEVLTAFFLEATFLGIMLFGMERVSGRVHVASSIIVAFGTTVSAFWILGLNTLEHQPAKIAALEAIWHTERGAGLTLLGIPNEEERRTDYALMLPKGASLILAHDANAELKGLDAFEDHPPVAPVFFAFRVMVGMGVLMLVVAWGSQYWLRTPPRWLLWIFAGFTFSGWIATLAGWLVTEIGRQPWLVTGILRTADAVGPAGGAKLGASLTAYVLTYTA